MSALQTTPPTPAPRPVTGPRPAGGRKSRGDRIRRALVAAGPALAAYLLVRCIGVAFVVLRTPDGGPSLGSLLASRFDTGFYIDIADNGYTALEPGSCAVQGPMCKYAFFPLYPMLIRGASAVLPLPTGTVAWGIAVTGALFAAWGIFAVARLLYGRRAATIAVVLWGIAPHAMVETMAYTEPIFTAIAAWTLYAVLTHRWAVAVPLAVLAGLTRPSGAAVVAAVALCAGWALVAAVRGRAGTANRTPPLVLAGSIVLAPLGWFAWFGWVGYRAGSWDGYLRIQEKWGSTFDAGRFTVRRISEIFTQAPVSLNAVVGALTVIAAVTLFIVCLQQRQHPALLIYVAVLLAITIGGAGYFHSRARFLLPAFPLLFPLARALAAARPRTAYTLLAAATLVSSAYGGYLLLVWHRSP
ncbi:glycosyltransferase family 39 protein [Streptomyces sp. NPDC055078]